MVWQITLPSLDEPQEIFIRYARGLIHVRSFVQTYFQTSMKDLRPASAAELVSTDA